MRQVLQQRKNLLQPSLTADLHEETQFVGKISHMVLEPELRGEQVLHDDLPVQEESQPRTQQQGAA